MDAPFYKRVRELVNKEIQSISKNTNGKYVSNEDHQRVEQVLMELLMYCDDRGLPRSEKMNRRTEKSMKHLSVAQLKAKKDENYVSSLTSH